MPQVCIYTIIGITYRCGVCVARSTELGYARCHYARASYSKAPAFLLVIYRLLNIRITYHKNG